jgi:enoyl-CoA hydratase/carnithine racemase
MITAISGPLSAYGRSTCAWTSRDRSRRSRWTGRSARNPLTFDSYAEMAAILRAAAHDDAVRAFVVTGAGGNFCSGGDVHEIIGPLLERDTKG